MCYTKIVKLRNPKIVTGYKCVERLDGILYSPFARTKIQNGKVPVITLEQYESSDLRTYFAFFVNGVLGLMGFYKYKEHAELLLLADNRLIIEAEIVAEKEALDGLTSYECWLASRIISHKIIV